MDTTKLTTTKAWRTACSTLVALLLMTGAFAQTEKQETLRSIRQADYFTVGRVGFTASVSEAEKAVWSLVKAKDEKSLVALTREKNVATRLYALVGLRYLNSTEYKPLAEELKKSTDTVQTLSGCIAIDKKVAEIASAIASGTYSKALENDMEPAKK